MGNKRKRPHADIQLIIDMYDVLLSYANYYTRDEERSQDIVQTLMMRLIERCNDDGDLQRIMYNGTPNRVYLFNAVRNIFLNTTRKAHLTIRINDNFDIQSDDDNGHSEICDNIYRRAERSVNGIRNNERGYYTKLFIEYFDNQKSLRQISEGSNISLKTVFNSVRHLKQHIHKNVKSLYNDRH